MLRSPYIPMTGEEQQKILDVVGVKSTEELFSAIPEELRLKEDLKLDEPISEYELKKQMQGLVEQNFDQSWSTCFLGAGVYDHIIPSTVKHITSRQEFYTSYTPYQPEISQGVLQATFEYQSMICELTGMDAANASLYDGSGSV